MNRLTILAVDDVEANRISLQYLIEEYCDDIDVILASSGEEALKVAYTTQIDLIILDIQMPGLDGFDTAQFLKKNTKTSHIPIIFLTAAFKKEEFQQRGFEIGAIDYLTKPIEDLQFINKLKLYKEVIFKTKELEHVNMDLYKALQEEIKIKNMIQKQQKELVEQTKMAALGEMIGNIAHQWRQPLSVIATCASGITAQKELGLLNEEEMSKLLEKITLTADELSKTIDMFRNFSHEDSSTRFSLSKLIDSLIQNKEFLLAQSNIEVVKDLDDKIIIDNFPSSLRQSMNNIVINAYEALERIEQENKYIFISVIKDEENKLVTISIKDNAGGIQEDDVLKVFEPYYTTKHQAQGVGMGLHVAYNSIVDSMNGKLTAKNSDYEYKGSTYKGAEFIITLTMV